MVRGKPSREECNGPAARCVGCKGLVITTVHLSCILQRIPTGKISVSRITLNRRLKHWTSGRLDELMSEARSIQQCISHYRENCSGYEST
ncbi:hypothetical protein GJ496_003463 [Pomphorhynchus laevis]|nr:hypothetical protein GJ496_003463 [Pomphorhynchus laevis]